MDITSIIVIFLRLIVPISVLRYPLAGIIASIVLDCLDGPLVSILSSESFGIGIITPQALDKLLDIYYLSFAFFVALRWKVRLVRMAIISLFSIRFIGTLLFLLTGFRPLLLFFPNIFELFFIYCLVVTKWSPRFYPDSLSKLLIILIFLGLPKIAVEYLLHYKQMGLIHIINFLTPLNIEAQYVGDWMKTILTGS